MCTHSLRIGRDHANSSARFIIHRPAPWPTIGGVSPKKLSSHSPSALKSSSTRPFLSPLCLEHVGLVERTAEDAAELLVVHLQTGKPQPILAYPPEQGAVPSEVWDIELAETPRRLRIVRPELWRPLEHLKMRHDRDDLAAGECRCSRQEYPSQPRDRGYQYRFNSLPDSTRLETPTSSLQSRPRRASYLPHTLTRAPRANPNAPATLSPCKTPTRPSISTPPLRAGNALLEIPHLATIERN